MTEPRELRCVGGPLDGQTLWTAAGIVTLAEDPDMEYVLTRPTDTDWRATYDHDWFIHGLDAPPPFPEHVLEWHERGWQSPEVAAIRGAYIEATNRVRGEPPAR